MDLLLRSLQTLTGEERKEAVSDLYDLETKEPGGGDAVLDFGYNVTPNADGTRTMTPLPDRNKVLRKLIPVLVAEIDDSEGIKNKAWWILIGLQTECPPPKREVWEKWWKDSGSKKFAPVSAR
ncbi:hypothetical protein [Prosthecobacter sp.]|uniref:hypothetical protein n=1 Tax=Prosthecobacter sp. TaxID=1965333 RepID=UPI0037845A65